MTFHVFRKVCKTEMILRLQNMTARLCHRHLSSMRGSVEQSSSQSKLVTFGDPSSISSVVTSVASVNPRLSALNLTAQYLSGGSLLNPATKDFPLKVHLPTASRPKVVSCPTLESLAIKKFIVEENLKRVEEPPAAKLKVEEPVAKHTIVEKRAIRMIVNRRIKMKKHQRKKLWQKMGLRFRADRVVREKKKELEFRAILAAKVTHGLIAKMIHVC